jgi:phage-related protein
MRLVRVARVVWDVLAITDDAGGNVLSELEVIDPSYRRHIENMRVMIEQFVPRNGPPIQNKWKCSPLGDDIFEFKTGPKKGKKLRVLWFYDAGDPIVRYRVLCTHSFLKQTRTTPPEEKERAVKKRKEYIQAKRFRALPIIEDREL